MSFIVDLVSPDQDIETAAALALAMAERKSKGLFTRKEYESVEVLARFILPLDISKWEYDGKSHCLAFIPAGLVTGSIDFNLQPDSLDFSFDDQAGEEKFLQQCQQLTKTVTEFKAAPLKLTGLVTEPQQIIPLLSDQDDSVTANFEQRADVQHSLTQLTQRLQQYQQAAGEWEHLKQVLYTHRDHLAVRLKEFTQQARDSGHQSLADLEAEVETAIVEKRKTIDAATQSAQEEHKKRWDLLQTELGRFQDEYKTNGESYWREQIQMVEKKISENDADLTTRKQSLEQELKEFEQNQRDRIKDLRTELDKRLAAFDERLKRLDAALEGFSKGLNQRLDRYSQQPKFAWDVELNISSQRCQQPNGIVFYAARYPGGRWQVFPPQAIASKGLLSKVSDWLGRSGLPFQPASNFAETMAAEINKLLPGSEVEQDLVEVNYLERQDFIAQVKTGLDRLVDQGQMDQNQVEVLIQQLES